MSGTEIGDYRFAGYSNEELAVMVDQIRQGRGSESMNRAVDALTAIANSLKQTDEVLRTELTKIGVEWTGASSDDAQVVMSDSSQYGGEATGTITSSAGAVCNQGDDYSRTRNCAPESSALRGAKDYNLADKLLLHTTDHSAEVKRTQAARAQAVDAMNGYANASKSNLGAYQALPVPPGLNLVAAPPTKASTGTSISSVGGGSAAFAPGGASIAGVPGGAPGVPVGSFDATGQPLVGGGQSGPHSGVPGQPGQPGVPGKMTGIGPMPGGGPLQPGFAQGTPPVRPYYEGMTNAVAGMVGGAQGGAAVGSVADKERLAPKTGGRPSALPPGGSRGTGSALSGLPPEEAAAARTAERVGAKSKPGASMMQPAAGTAQGEEDEEHVRKYGIEAEDVFADGRMVMPSVLGEDDDE
ncbi:hypothetical protein ALI144C_44160 [Actinosynnema sp. ALI-1.44]|uniref:hypothetical protein n=1 Tax=Actinosynnema sp. ALI-1.44 TaxID=1933779 RepID=UPI00097BAE33|nr:hypothetical protein [Actinosynnema sp. ALI-1.44]ONI72964.1 hypothetical protein ALI144C_44160 [Actinosynnema sp. ALI-1.44]